MAYSDRDRVYVWLDAGHGEKLTMLDRVVLMTIAERANATSGLSAPGIDEPARRWGAKPKSVDRSIARLHALGLVDTVTRGRGQSRARYVLTGELAKVGPPTGGPTSSPETSSSSPETSSRSSDGRTVLSESSRSSNEVRTTPLSTSSDDDAAARASAMGSGAASSDKSSTRRVSLAVHAEVTEALGLEEEAARSWTEDVLARATRTVGNPDAYIRRSIAAELAQQKKAKAKSAAKPKGKSGAKSAKGKRTRHVKVEPTPCPEPGCEFVAKNPSTLGVHTMAKHARDCPRCRSRFRPESYEEHFARCRGRSIYIPRTNTFVEIDLSTEARICPLCQRDFGESVGHHVQHCRGPKPPPPASPQPILCRY